MAEALGTRGPIAVSAGNGLLFSSRKDSATVTTRLTVGGVPDGVDS